MISPAAGQKKTAGVIKKKLAMSFGIEGKVGHENHEITRKKTMFRVFSWVWWLSISYAQWKLLSEWRPLNPVNYTDLKLSFVLFRGFRGHNLQWLL